MGHHERRWSLMTAGRWPWKSESAKECATTHLPKQPALKMDGAEAFCLYTTVTGMCDVHCDRSSSMESYRREIWFGTRRAPHLRRCPDTLCGP
ncbi:unnamed protein product [Arctia plantaginis]|uniref:Uncharacterized protein n=1 Tax=Arctia plantaginis TaxID=874455 RepID=A0A8S1BDT7_ARCPL|nr:unnamed protein product [Arctia plantaginis]CAB3237867.1 unnamed protein product [Arctia plantaginis]CAB3256013.1 unnamed protein product [Arctia plantaginis]CAB3258473.1 unnamed protein product [Arctia plantaginis]CAB3260668.1 unnamed protein product [Arctia plantaginis]